MFNATPQRLALAACLWHVVGVAAAPGEGAQGLKIIGHEAIMAAGARNLADLLQHVAGVRIATDHSRSFATSGALASSDSGTQLGANQASRVRILFNGHSLNKAWFGGADQDWNTGFLEGLKEIRVHTGPAVESIAGPGALDMVIDLVPFQGSDLQGRTDLRLTQSRNRDRLDTSHLHMGSGDRWGRDGQYAWFADFSKAAGEDVRRDASYFSQGDRIGRTGNTWQAGTVLDKANTTLTARYLEHDTFDPHATGRNWSYGFMEGGRHFQLSPTWILKVNLSYDRIRERWGAASSQTGSTSGEWDEVLEHRATLRAEATRNHDEGSLKIRGEWWYLWAGGGPEGTRANLSVMGFSARQGGGALTVSGVRTLGREWTLEGALRAERNPAAASTSLLPTATLTYRELDTTLSLRLIQTERPMDFWYRVGSGNYGPSVPGGFAPYILPSESHPERHQQVRLGLDQELMDGWSLSFVGFHGRYQHLMGVDWDAALAANLEQLRVTDVGGFSYHGATGMLFYRQNGLNLEANLSWQRTAGGDVDKRQLYLSTQGDQPLYLSPVVGNLLADWRPGRHWGLSLRYHYASSARNGGTDFSSPTFAPVFNVAPYEDTRARGTVDVSVRALDLWKGLELQASVHNAGGNQTPLPLVEGGFYEPRNRELTFTARWKF